MSQHPLCCDCDLCIGSGLRLGYTPIVHKTLGRPNAALKDRAAPFALSRATGRRTEPVLVLRNAYSRVMRRRQERSPA